MAKKKETPGTLSSIAKIINFFTGGAAGQTTNEKIKAAGRKAANKKVRAKFGK